MQERAFVHSTRVGDVVATHLTAILAATSSSHSCLSLSGVEEGGEVIALDGIGVGIGERVLVVQKGTPHAHCSSPNDPEKAWSWGH